MELRQLTTFKVVSETLSFTRAAEQLKYAQSSVTAQIQSLEEELGTTLFERLGKRIILTEAGGRLLKYADQMVRLADEARLAVPGTAEPSGTLQIGAAESLLTYRLPPVFGLLKQRYPRVNLIFRPGVCSEMRRTVADGGLDACFVIEQSPTDGPCLYDDLGPTRVSLVVPPNHRLAACAAVGPEDLVGETYLGTEAGCTYRVVFEQMLARVGVKTAAQVEFGSIEAIKQCVMGGMGFSVVNSVAVANEVANGQLVELNWTGPPFNLRTYLCWHRDKWQSPALSAFLNVAREVFGRQSAPAA